MQHAFLEQHSTIEHVGVDPFVAGNDPEDLFDKDVGEIFGVSPAGGMERLFATVSEKLRLGLPGRYKSLRLSSTEVAKSFEDDSLEFVFVDGAHREVAVRADLEAWWPKIQPGGVLGGHDYCRHGVEKAVTSYFSDVRHEVVLLETAGKEHKSFWQVKQPG